MDHDPAKEKLHREREEFISRIRENFFPSKFDADVKLNDAVLGAFRKHIVRGYAPPAPIVPARARVASIGSCFAEEISKTLTAQGVDVAYIAMSERWNSPFALSRFLDKALFDVPFPPDFLAEAQLAPTLAETARQFAAADLFILTCGLSLCWFERTSGKLVLEPGNSHSIGGLHRAMANYEMRQTGVEENEREILRCVDLVKKARPDAKIVLTLSPVPLVAAAGGVAPIPANLISKATLRAALGNVTARNLENVYYWPSYDFIMWFGAHITAAFGGEEGRDMRHVRTDLVDLLAQFFKEYYFQR